VTHDLDLLTAKNGFPELIVKHCYVKISLYHVEKQTDTQTNGGENRTPRLPSVWVINN